MHTRCVAFFNLRSNIIQVTLIQYHTALGTLLRWCHLLIMAIQMLLVLLLIYYYVCFSYDTVEHDSSLKATIVSTCLKSIRTTCLFEFKMKCFIITRCIYSLKMNFFTMFCIFVRFSYLEDSKWEKMLQTGKNENACSWLLAVACQLSWRTCICVTMTFKFLEFAQNSRVRIKQNI